MRLECIKSYYDVELNKHIVVGDKIDNIKEDRAKHLIDVKVCKEIKEIRTTKQSDVLEEHKVKIENNKITKKKKVK